MRLPGLLLAALALTISCTADGRSPGASSAGGDDDGPFAAGKADGLLDIAPALTFSDSVAGEVSGNNVELFVLELQRTDEIELTMTVTGGDLNPHMTLLLGAWSKVDSESWHRDGAALIKAYKADEAGRYLLAVRAYRGEGAGTYTISMACKGGPCNGEFPDPASELHVRDAALCIEMARACAFEQMPRFHGAVGPARAKRLLEDCLGTVALEDGSSCAAACDWKGEYADRSYDDARGFCDVVEGSLIFFADQAAPCVGTLDSCVHECLDAAQYGYRSGDDFGDQAIVRCLESGFNGNCEAYARDHSSCGGKLIPDSAGECSAQCFATSGAHVDDLDTMCSYDSDCDHYCDVDLAAAATACGGLTRANEGCLLDHIDDGHAWVCEDTLEERLGD